MLIKIASSVLEIIKCASVGLPIENERSRVERG